MACENYSLWQMKRGDVLEFKYINVDRDSIANLAEDIFKNLGGVGAGALANDKNSVQFRDTLVFNTIVGVVQFIWG